MREVRFRDGAGRGYLFSPFLSASLFYLLIFLFHYF
jgi:hypothetical protein